jgi:sigma-B regulation protein RsbU (phosphoserine phosphatase)
MIQLKSLNQRMALYMLFPVAILLFGMGFAGFIYAKNSLLIQWGEATALKLQRAAHHVDMRLNAPKELLKVFHKTADKPNAHYIQEAIIEQLKRIDSVARVSLTWIDQLPGQPKPNDQMQNRNRERPHHAMGKRSAMMRFHRAGLLGVTPPSYDSLIENETVSLISELKDEGGQTVGKLEVVLRFDSLIDIEDSGWWENQKAFLVDNDGKVITGNTSKTSRQLVENNNTLELETLKALREKTFGTVFDQGHPPSEVIGFYRLTEAPWTLVMVAPGKEVLAPITSFRFYYSLTGVLFILLIILLIRWVTGHTVSSIKDVSKAAERVAKGQFSTSLPVKTRDEVGELTQSFNTMMIQLQERMKLKRELDLAMEVQQNLLPKSDPKIEGLDISGKSKYCDETGGDYYDFLDIGDHKNRKVGVVVGDVSGHGIPSALLMATARASLRQRSQLSDDIASIISGVNVQLSKDVEDSGRFMTMFLLSINLIDQSLEWVRAGHDPAFLYDPNTDKFHELRGPGFVLGVDQEWRYEANKKSGFAKGQIILLGTDGIWEARNREGKMFGKEPIYEIIRQNPDLSAKEIVDAIFSELTRFQGDVKQEDDITLVVIKNDLDY